MASLWNPNDISNMALPPCHYGFQIYINDGKLDLSWNQRSVDMFLGLPYDIAMYGLLLEMLAKGFGYKPGSLIAFLGDCHIYNNHINQVREYLSREDGELPILKLKKGITIEGSLPTHGDIELINYNPQKPIKAPLAT
jgi:thymidylate synthase